MKYLLVIAVLLSFTVPDKAQAVTVLGSADCGQWLKWRTDSQKIRQSEWAEFWLVGYLSGLSFSINTEFWKSGNGLSVEQVKFWMDKYCRENPLTSVKQGADILFHERTGY